MDLSWPRCLLPSCHSPCVSPVWPLPSFNMFAPSPCFARVAKRVSVSRLTWDVVQHLWGKEQQSWPSQKQQDRETDPWARWNGRALPRTYPSFTCTHQRDPTAALRLTHGFVVVLAPPGVTDKMLGGLGLPKFQHSALLPWAAKEVAGEGSPGNIAACVACGGCWALSWHLSCPHFRQRPRSPLLPVCMLALDSQRRDWWLGQQLSYALGECSTIQSTKRGCGIGWIERNSAEALISLSPYQPQQPLRTPPPPDP